MMVKVTFARKWRDKLDPAQTVVYAKGWTGEVHISVAEDAKKAGALDERAD